MPAGSPPGGLDRRFLLSRKLMENFGADISVNFQVSARDNVNGNIMIGGNNDYVGLITEGIFSQPRQGAVLPLTGNTMDRCCHNFSDRGWFITDTNNAVFRLNAGLTSAATITPPAVTSRAGIVEYNGRVFILTASLNLPDRDLEISDDNGATWDSDPGLFTGANVNGKGLYTNFNQNRLLAIFSGGFDFFTTTAGDGASGWTAFPAGNSNVPMNAGSISDDGERFCVVSQNGAVATQDGVIDPSNNPWQSTVASGNSIEICQWIQALNGWMIVSNIGPHVGFIDAGDTTRVIPGSYMADPVTILDENSISDGEQMMVPGNGNLAMITLREIGQTGLA